MASPKLQTFARLLPCPVAQFGGFSVVPLQISALLPRAISVIEEAVANGDSILAKWVVEMRLGRPRQQLDAEVQNRRTIDQITIVDTANTA